jgi:RimJ/RimL family protein N-acetyltransferase
MNIHHLAEVTRRFGIKATAGHAALRAANSVAPVRVLRVLLLGMRSRVRQLAPRGYRVEPLGADALVTAVRERTDLDMDHRFVAAALARGDRCFGTLSGDTVTSYAWYSTRATPIGDGLWLEFAEEHAYMYKAFTVPEHRGRRLHGAGVSRALALYAASGYRGLVCYIDADNFASLRAHRRIGFRDIGTIVHVAVGDRIMIHASEGCHRHGVRLIARGQEQTSPSGVETQRA